MEKYLLKLKTERHSSKNLSKNRHQALFDNESSESESENSLPFKRQKTSEESPLSPCIVQKTSNNGSNVSCGGREIFRDMIEGDSDKSSDSSDKDIDFREEALTRPDEDHIKAVFRDNDEISESTAIQSSSRNTKQNKSKNNRLSKSRSYQSRLQFRRTPSPIFMNDDVSTLTKQHSSSNQKSKKSSKSKPRQKKMDNFIEVNVSDNDDDELMEDLQVIEEVYKKQQDRQQKQQQQQINTTPSPLLSLNTSGFAQSSIFRIKVRINKHFLVIPCPNSQELKVDWLIQEVIYELHYLTINHAFFRVVYLYYFWEGNLVCCVVCFTERFYNGETQLIFTYSKSTIET